MYKKSIGLRLVAFLIDALVVLVIGIILTLFFGFGSVTKGDNSINFSMNWWQETVVFFGYYFVFAVLFKGVTIGKLITGVRIRKDDMTDAGRGKIIIREMIKGILIIISLISFIVMLVQEDRKSIHDLIVNTIVIRKAKRNDYIQPDAANG